MFLLSGQARSLDLHDFSFLVGKQMVNGADHLIRQLLNLVGALALIVLADASVLLGLLQKIHAIAADVPRDRLLVETDAPYLAPVPFRGKRNEPSFVVQTAKVLAETIGVSEAEIAKLTTDNFFRLFSKMPRPGSEA